MGDTCGTSVVGDIMAMLPALVGSRTEGVGLATIQRSRRCGGKLVLGWGWDGDLAITHPSLSVFWRRRCNLGLGCVWERLSSAFTWTDWASSSLEHGAVSACTGVVT